MIDRICSLIKMKKPEMNRGLLFASGADVPADTSDGFQTGCLFQKTDGGAGTSLYINEGSVTSSSFQAIAALTAAQEALLTATAGTVSSSKCVIVDSFKTLRWGGFNTGAALTDAVPFASVPDTWSDGQLDVLAVFGGTGADLTGLVSAKCGRYRHVVNFSGTQNGEMYGLVGQVVAKTVVLGLYSAGLMGTIESHGGFHAGKGTTTSYPVHAGVIGRPGGASIVVDADAILAAVAALSNTTGITATAGDYAGVYVAKCQASNDAFTVGVKIADDAATTAIVIGSCMTGIKIDGTIATHSIAIGKDAHIAFDTSGDKNVCIYSDFVDSGVDSFFIGLYSEVRYKPADLDGEASVYAIRGKVLTVGTYNNAGDTEYVCGVHGAVQGVATADIIGDDFMVSGVRGELLGAATNWNVKSASAVEAKIGLTVAPGTSTYYSAFHAYAPDNAATYPSVLSADGYFSLGLNFATHVTGLTNFLALPAAGTAPVSALGAVGIHGTTTVKIACLIGGSTYYLLASTVPTA